jgi:signal transduction histidine kinase
MYKQVVFHLIKNSLLFSKVCGKIRVFICYVKLDEERLLNSDLKDDLEFLGPRYKSRLGTIKWINNSDKVQKNDGYIITKIFDDGEGMDQVQLNEAFRGNKV